TTASIKSPNRPFSLNIAVVSSLSFWEISGGPGLKWPVWPSKCGRDVPQEYRINAIGRKWIGLLHLGNLIMVRVLILGLDHLIFGQVTEIAKNKGLFFQMGFGPWCKRREFTRVHSPLG